MIKLNLLYYFKVLWSKLVKMGSRSVWILKIWIKINWNLIKIVWLWEILSLKYWIIYFKLIERINIKCLKGRWKMDSG